MKRIPKCEYCLGTGHSHPKAAQRARATEEAKKNDTWKALEKSAALLLGGKRVSRGNNWGFSTVDIRLKDFRFIKIDAKKRKAHAHHTFLHEIEWKYCKREGDVPLLITKEPKQRGEYVSVPIEHYAKLLYIARAFMADMFEKGDHVSSKEFDIIAEACGYARAGKNVGVPEVQKGQRNPRRRGRSGHRIGPSVQKVQGGLQEDRPVRRKKDR